MKMTDATCSKHRSKFRSKMKTFAIHPIFSMMATFLIFLFFNFNDLATADLQNDSWLLLELTTMKTISTTSFSGAIPTSIYSDFNIRKNITNYTNNNVNNNNNSVNSNKTVINNPENLNATGEVSYVPYIRRPETYIVPVLFALIFIVGVVGNGTLIIVFLMVRQMRNVPNTYILSLALADLLVIVITVPLTSTVYTVDSWPWGSFLCTLSEFIKDVSIGVSVFTLTALSGDRYFAIVDPLRKFHAHGVGKRATRITIAIAISIWVLAIICGLPALIATHVKTININRNKSFAYCYPFPDEWGLKYAELMVLLRFLIYYAIPFVIIGVFYALIARHLMYAANVPGELQGAIRQIRARRKVAMTVLAFALIFCVCFLPYHVFMLWFYYCPTSQTDYNAFWHVLRIVGFCLSFANSCANPVALYFVSGSFRKHFNRYLFCRGTVIRHKKRKDIAGIHRDTSLTSSISKRFQSRRSLQHQSTIRSRVQETTISTLPIVVNASHNGYNNGSNNSTITAIAITSIAAGTSPSFLATPHMDLTEASLTNNQRSNIEKGFAVGKSEG